MLYVILFTIISAVIFYVGNYAYDLNKYNNDTKFSLVFGKCAFKYNLTIRRSDKAMLDFKVFDKNNNELYFSSLGHDSQELVIKTINNKLIQEYVE